MGDGIDLKESWGGFIPLVGFDWDASLDKGSGFGGGQPPFAVFRAFSGHEAIDSGGRDGEELLFDVLFEDEFVVVGQPEGDECFEAFGTGQIGGYPDISEHLGDEGVVVKFFTASFSIFLAGRCFEIEHSDGVFAMVAADPAAVIQHGPLLGFGGMVIKLSQRLDVLSFGSIAHHFCLLL